MPVTDWQWLQKGKKGKTRWGEQKEALIKALHKPMPGTELLASMQQQFPKLELPQITRLLRSLEDKGLVQCLNASAITGRIYYFTEEGQSYAEKKYNISARPLLGGINWRKYGRVIAGKARRDALLAMENPWRGMKEKTKGELRKMLSFSQGAQGKHPMGMSAAIRAVNELEDLGLIKRKGRAKRGESLYVISLSGRRIIAQLRQPEKTVNPLQSRLMKEDGLNPGWEGKSAWQD